MDTSCAKQSVVALSSGKAEFYAMTRGAANGLMSKHILEEIGYEKIKLVLRTDSTAAKGIATRKGVGKVKRLSLKELWLQDYVRQNELKIVKEPTSTNWADLGTKSLTGTRISELLSIMPILLNSILLARAQGPKDQEDSLDLSWFLCYMFLKFLVHVFAVIGFMAVVKH